MDISGTLYIDERLDLESGLFIYNIPNKLLHNGIYFVLIQNQAGDHVVKRLVKHLED